MAPRKGSPGRPAYRRRGYLPRCRRWCSPDPGPRRGRGSPCPLGHPIRPIPRSHPPILRCRRPPCRRRQPVRPASPPNKRPKIPGRGHRAKRVDPCEVLSVLAGCSRVASPHRNAHAYRQAPEIGYTLPRAALLEASSLRNATANGSPSHAGRYGCDGETVRRCGERS